jgi:hypothetical protein
VPSATFGKVGAEEESAWKLSRGGRGTGGSGSGRRGGRRGTVGGVVGPERAGLQVEESVLSYYTYHVPPHNKSVPD